MSNLNNQINQIGQQLRAENAENALTQARSALHIERMQNISASSASDLGDTLSIISLEAQIKDKDNMILEWMHSNEVFKRLAKSYGAQLGLDAEQRIKNISEMFVATAEENPNFAKTKIGLEAKAAIKK